MFNSNFRDIKVSYRYAFVPLFSFNKNQKQESGHQVGGLVAKNISIFC